MIELICITCPAGCNLQVEQAQDGTLQISGNECKRGAAFAQAELTRPMRSLTSTVRTTFPDTPMLPVRTDREIPKAAIPAAMRFLAGVVVRQAVTCGDVIAELPGAGANVIATGSLG